MNTLPFHKALILAPHIDDAEFGCGGMIHRLVSAGCEVHYLAFSDCRASIPDGYDADILRQELAKAKEVLGISSATVLDFEVRRFTDYRQEILQAMVDFGRSKMPDLVLTPSREDIHQDHQVVCMECIRAFKHTTIMGYELPWNCLKLSSEVLVTLTEENLKKKIEAIQCYLSQSHRPYYNEEYIRSLAHTVGLRIGKQWAEAFEVIRWVVD